MMPDHRPTALIEKAKTVWLKVGDCQLDSWDYKSLEFSDVVTATGRPPRCRRLYKHVFVFATSDGKHFRLKSILRDTLFRRIDWLGNGQPVKGRQQYMSFDLSTLFEI